MNIKNPIIVGFLWSISTSICLLLVLILMVQFTSLPEYSLPTLTYAIHMTSILIGSIIAGIRACKKGWYFGLLTGLSYMLFILIIGSILFTSISFNVDSLIQTVIGIFIGMVGGIVGVNFSNK